MSPEKMQHFQNGFMETVLHTLVLFPAFFLRGDVVAPLTCSIFFCFSPTTTSVLTAPLKPSAWAFCSPRLCLAAP